MLVPAARLHLTTRLANKCLAQIPGASSSFHALVPLRREFNESLRRSFSNIVSVRLSAGDTKSTVLSASLGQRRRIDLRRNRPKRG
jgi:hypothetical protein